MVGEGIIGAEDVEGVLGGAEASEGLIAQLVILQTPQHILHLINSHHGHVLLNLPQVLYSTR
jgi:hypothetical protein